MKRASVQRALDERASDERALDERASDERTSDERARGGLLSNRLLTPFLFLVLLGSAVASGMAAPPPRGYLGLALVAADAPTRPEGESAPWEVAGRIVHLVPNATAERAGLRLGDLLLEVDGRAFTREGGGPPAQLREMLAGRVRGDRLVLKFLHRSLVSQVLLDGEPVADAIAIVHDLPAQLEALESGQSLALSSSREERLVELGVELGPHPFDLPRQRPALADEQAFAHLLGEANELELFGRVVIERFGLTEPTRDLRERLARLHDSDDGLRLDLVGFIHRNPWRIEEASRDLLGELAPEGGRAELPRRLQAASALHRASLVDYYFEPLRGGLSAEGHADQLERVLKETAGLVAQAFAHVSRSEQDVLLEGWSELAAGLKESIYLHADPNRDRRRRNLEWIEIAKDVDLAALHAAALSWSRLAEPGWLAALAVDLGSHERADERVLLRRETPLGDILIGGRGDDTWRGEDFAILIELGGDDRHQNAAGSSRGPSRPAAAVIDLAGDDAWEATQDGAQGFGLLGVGLLVDLEGDDRYVARDWAQGAGLLGIGMLVDAGGNDRFRAQHLSQGAAGWGAGILLDLSGDDLREAVAFSQGFGLPGAVGLVHDSGGDDQAWAKGGPPSSYGTPGVFDSWSQGCGMGLRWLQSGGIGLHVDDSGSDDYEAGNFSQGGGYYFGWGLLADRGRQDDVYIGSRYAQGFSAHQAVGTFLEEGGDDRYLTRNGANAGLAWDESVTLFRDAGGRDEYRTGFFSLGASAHNSICFFVDESGSDTYTGQAPGRAGGNDYHGGSSLSIFLDLGPGRDHFEAGPAPGRVVVRDGNSIVADLPSRIVRDADPVRLEQRLIDER